MNFTLMTGGLALLAALFAAGAFTWRWRETLRRLLAVDHSPAKDSAGRGVVYAFTLGMAPWAKESTRRHGLAYLRGIAFHVGIFAGLAALAASPVWRVLPTALLWLLAGLSGFGALSGVLGAAARWIEPNLRALSTADDHAAVWLVTLFLATTGLALVAPAWMPAMYLTGAVMLIYAPLGKIRHCIYFFFSRWFFGRFVGRRGVVHPQEAK